MGGPRALGCQRTVRRGQNRTGGIPDGNRTGGSPLPASESDSEADQRPPRETKEAEEARKQAMREVVDALRPLVAARTRAELYALLRDELSRRDVQVDDPLLLETALDLVQADSKAQRRRISWRILGDTVGSI